MPNLTPTPGYDPVYQIETYDRVLGGPGGVANLQAQALLNRTELARRGFANPFFDPDYSTEINGYPLNAIVMLDNGEIVQSIIPNNTNDPNVDTSGWINPGLMKGLKSVESIQELISQKTQGNGQMFYVKSYHSGKSSGGDLFMWSTSISKSLHDGGYIIDPTIPVPALSAFNTYYPPQNSGSGVFIRLNNKQDIAAENFGLIDDNTMVWNCAAVMAAFNRAKKLQNGLSTPKGVTAPSGIFLTTNPIEPALYQVNSRIPSFKGQGSFATEFRKTTSNPISNNYSVTGIDAAYFVMPPLALGLGSIFGENIEGVAFSRDRDSAFNKVGYGYYTSRSPISSRRDIRCLDFETSYWQDDCWMSQANQIQAVTCVYGPIIRGGTSVVGANIYADRCTRTGIDLYGLTYSHLTVHADGCGTDPTSPTGYPAVNAQFVKGCTLVASCERHRGTDFYLQSCDGLTVTSGRTLGAVAVQAATPKVYMQDCVVEFLSYSWRYALDNLTDAEKALYTHRQVVGNSVNYEFRGCQGNSFWNDFPIQVSDSQYTGVLSSQAYCEESGTIKSRVVHNNATFKKLLYAGGRSRFKVLHCSASDADRYYDFTATVSIAGLSTNSASPTTLPATLYALGVAQTGPALVAYLNTTDNWVYVRPQVAGENRTFRYTLLV